MRYVFRNSLPGNWRGRHFQTGEYNKCLNFVLQQNPSNGEFTKRLTRLMTTVAEGFREHMLASWQGIPHNKMRWKESCLHTEQERGVELLMTTHTLIQSHKAQPTSKR